MTFSPGPPLSCEQGAFFHKKAGQETGRVMGISTAYRLLGRFAPPRVGNADVGRLVVLLRGP